VIPLRDVIPSRTTPWITFLLIVANVLVFINELRVGAFSDPHARFFLAHGLVPAHFSWVSALSAMFVHAGWWHLGGNMWSLWIFGDNVEDRMGHGRFLVFYLIAGLVANLAQTYAAPDALVPLVGASGAIAGVMGAYLVLFPHSRILVLIPLIIFFDVIEVPAVFFLGFWFLVQLLGGVGSLAEAGTAGGVAFWAHAGGFLTGLAGVWILERRERRRADWWSA
jgi:membrane associated rhomboid family serine protease